MTNANQNVTARDQSRRHKSGSSQVDRGWAWMVLLASGIHQIILSFGYSMGIFNIIFLQIYNKDKQTTAWIASVQGGVFCLLGPLSSFLIHHIGCKNTVILGGLVSALGMFLASFATNFIFMLFTFGFLVGVGNGIAYIPWVVAVGDYFKHYRNLAYGIGSASVGLGTMILSPLVQYLEGEYGWRGCMMIMSGVFLHLVAAGLIFRPIRPVEEIQTLPPDRELRINHAKLRPPKWVHSMLSLASVQCGHTLSKLNMELDKDVDMHASLMELPKSPSLSMTIHKAKQSQSYDNLASHQTRDNGQYITVRKQDPNSQLHPDKLLMKSAIIHKIDNGDDVCQLENGIGLENGIVKCVGPKQDVKTSYNFWHIFLNKRLMILCLSCFCCSGANSVNFIHFPAFFRMHGASDNDLSVIMTVIGCCSMSCRLLMGMMTNNKEISVLLLFFSGCGLTSVFSLLCPLLGQSAGGRIIFALGIGFYGNTYNVLLAPMTLEVCNLEDLSVAVGLLLVMCGVGSFLGPPFAGWLYDSSGTYLLTFVCSGTAGLLGCLCVMMIATVGEKKDELDSVPKHKLNGGESKQSAQIIVNIQANHCVRNQGQ